MKLSRPHASPSLGIGRLKPAFVGAAEIRGWLPGPNVLAKGDAGLDENSLQTRMTPTGLPEQDLLAAVNYLDDEALQEFPGIGPKIAEGIVEWRKAKGYIASLDDLIEVPLIGAKRFESLIGRPCDATRFALHRLIRLSCREVVRESHFRPLANPAKGLGRIF